MTQAHVITKVRQYYAPKSALFGLVTWKELVKTDQLGTEVHITTNCERIYINGTEVKL